MWIKNFKQLFLFWLIMIMIFSINLLSAQQKIDKKFIVRTFIDENGKSIDEIIVPGRPPVDYREPAVVLPDPNTSETINVLTNVPAFDWSYGCSATSAAMMAGYYDNTIHPEMYTGPTNNGVVPMNNSSWGTGECPLSATHQGYDGLSSRGHVDDYWISYGSTASDPYITGGWTPHTNADCTADFMGTNQSAFGNTDGATTFYNYTDGSILYDYTGCEPGQKDGTHGLREFFESRGYAIQYNSGNYQNYSQYIMGYSGNTLGFTFDQYKAEIDAGRPVLIQVEGHTMLGLGYDDSTNLVYIHDTWDHSNHTMTWGGSYSGMAHYAVGVFILEDPSITVTSPNGGEIWGLGTTQNITWTSQYVSNIDIDLYNSGSFVMSIAADVSSSLGSFPWFVPTGLPLNSQYSIKISDSDASSNDDYSDGYFTINNFSALIDVTPITLSTTLEPDEQDTQQIHITNIGAPGSILNYSLSHSFTDTDNISGSYIVCSSANYTPGATTNWTFSVYNASTDSEWITDIYITLPDGVTVNSGSDFIGGFYPLIYDGSTGNGVTIHWYDGDGGWGNIYEGETASSTINVSISPSLTGNLTLDYQIDGDTYGGEPHTISDSMLILHETWLSYNPSNGSCAQGETDDIDVTLDATDLPLGTYTADLLITNDGGGPVVIPVTMNIVDPPDIEISTDSFSEDLYTDETSIQLLIVNNVGGEQLDFTATLDPVVSWLELNPDNGSVDPYTGTIAVDVDFNSSSLTTGTYNTNIVINSNDPVEPEITISVSLVVHNSAPTIILPDEFTFTEDGSLIVDFSAYIDDVDPDDLTLMVTGNIEVVVDITGTVVTFSSPENWFGTETLTFTVNDNVTDLTAEDDVDVVVTPVNDPPIIDIIGTFEAEEDLPSQTYDFSVFCSQVWGEEDVLSLAADNSVHIDVTITDFNVIFESNTPDWNGTEDITIYLNDNVSRGRDIVSQTISVTINPVNDAPTIILPDEFTFTEDGSLIVDFSAYIDDVDPDDLTLMVTGNIEVVVDITGTVVTFSSPENWFGTETLTFTVNDNVTDLTAEDYVDVLVTPVNDEPILISYLPETLTFTVSQDSIVTFIVNVEDIDSDLTYEWYIDEVMQQVTSEEFIYQFVDLGEIEVKSVVSDEEYSIIMTWSVTVEPLSESGEIIPIANALFQNHPNPFNPMTTIRYSLIEAGKVTINIYNIKGELIKTLINGNYQAGDHQVIWDGRDDSGRIISSGVYFYHMLTDQYSSTRKMILMK